MKLLLVIINITCIDKARDKNIWFLIFDQHNITLLMRNGHKKATLVVELGSIQLNIDWTHLNFQVRFQVSERAVVVGAKVTL